MILKAAKLINGNGVMNRDEIVLFSIKRKPVTCYNFPQGIHYKDAILHLRAKGHDIRMIMIDDPEGIKRQIGRYSYHGKAVDKEVVKHKFTDAQNSLISLIEMRIQQIYDYKGLMCEVYFLQSMLELLQLTKQNKQALGFLKTRVLKQTPTSS